MKSALKAMFGSLSPWGKFWLYLGLASLAAAAGMSFAVGWKMTALHAVFLACLSFVTAFLPDAAYQAWNEGRRGVAIALTVLAVPLFAVEFGQHAAYTAGIRGHDLATARVQNVKYDDGRKNVEEARQLLVMFEKRLADLQGENKWSTTVTADALRARMQSLNLAIDLEAKRGGCKSKCLERTKERDDTASRIAVLERVDDMTAKIEATKKVIADARTKSATVEHKSSQTEHMNQFLSKAVALIGQGSLKPDEVTEEGTQLSANLGLALAASGLPALALFVAGLYRRQEDDEPAPVVAAKSSPQATSTVHVIENKADLSEFWKVLNSTLNTKHA